MEGGGGRGGLSSGEVVMWFLGCWGFFFFVVRRRSYWFSSFVDHISSKGEVHLARGLHQQCVTFFFLHRNAFPEMHFS